MPSRLRTSIGTRLSFFSFQDIITSVTGILILVTLILALYLDPSVPVGAASQDFQQRLTVLLDELAGVNAENELRQRSIQRLASAPGIEQLQSDIQQWTEQVRVQSNRLTILAQTWIEREADAGRKAEKLGLSDLRERAGTIVKDLEKQRLTNAVAATEVKQIESQLEELRSKSEQAATNQHRLWILPGSSPSGKQPLLVSVSRAGLTSERFNQPASRQQFPLARAAEGFSRSLGQLRSDRDYIVFYVRPSGIDLFTRCLEIAKRAGFQVGYDAIEEDKQILFSTPTPP